VIDDLPGFPTPPAGCLGSIAGSAALGTGCENRLGPTQDHSATAQGNRSSLVLAGQQQAPEEMAGMDLKGPGSRTSPLTSARCGVRVHPEHSVRGPIAAL
jgi:hypothetical protein